MSCHEFCHKSVCQHYPNRSCVCSRLHARHEVPGVTLAGGCATSLLSSGHWRKPVVFDHTCGQPHLSHTFWKCPVTAEMLAGNCQTDVLQPTPTRRPHCLTDTERQQAEAAMVQGQRSPLMQQLNTSHHNLSLQKSRSNHCV